MKVFADVLLKEFYISLGSQRLSALIKEDYILAKEVIGSKAASETRHLILERLPLFLHEHSQSKMKVTLEWLQNEKNLSTHESYQIECSYRRVQRDDLGKYINDLAKNKYSGMYSRNH